MSIRSYIAFLLFFASCSSIPSVIDTDKVRLRQDSIINTYANGCAHKFNYRVEMNDWQSCLDTGLALDSTIAYLWQQKAMPYFKERKYEVGMDYLNRAVRYDNETYLPYRGFIKCIFLKDYKEAIKDFEECQRKYGERHEMDHTYTFYLALSHLQLNHFDIAEKLLKKTIDEQKKIHEEAHHIDLFYHAIALLELKRYEEAIIAFDRVLKIYPQFSDALYYKGNCLLHMKRPYEEYLALVQEGQKFAKEGYSINEANAVYERYPYQVNWN